MAMVINRFEIWLIRLDPTKGSEIKRTRPCVVVAPDELNHHLSTTIVAPMTTKGKPYPFRIRCSFKGKKGLIVLDQLRTVVRVRFIRRLGRLDRKTSKVVLNVLQEMFAA
jgi:mRNA interferase MazF